MSLWWLSTLRLPWNAFAYWVAVSRPRGVLWLSSLASVRDFIFCVASKLLMHLFLEGSTVAVFGCGAIGLGVIATAALVGASRIIAVDTNPGKESWARKFGAHEFVNPTTLPEGKRIQDHLVDITDGGLDYTFDATGNVRVSRR